MDQVEFYRVSCADFFDFTVAGPDRFNIEANLFENRLGSPNVSANVVITNQSDIIRACLFFELELADDVIADRVVGDMMTQRL